METDIDRIPDQTDARRIETVVSGSSWVENTTEVVCAISLIAMMVVISAETVARNVFSTSLQITDEIGGYLLVALTFLSMSIAEANGAFHRVEFIQRRLGYSARIVSQIVFEIISLGASVLVTWQLCRLTLNSWHTEDVAPTLLQTPLWLPQSVMAIGMALLCLALVRTILLKVKIVRSAAR